MFKSKIRKLSFVVALISALASNSQANDSETTKECKLSPGLSLISAMTGVFYPAEETEEKRKTEFSKHLETLSEQRRSYNFFERFLSQPDGRFSFLKREHYDEGYQPHVGTILGVGLQTMNYCIPFLSVNVNEYLNYARLATAVSGPFVTYYSPETSPLIKYLTTGISFTAILSKAHNIHNTSPNTIRSICIPAIIASLTANSIFNSPLFQLNAINLMLKSPYLHPVAMFLLTISTFLKHTAFGLGVFILSEFPEYLSKNFNI